MIHIFVSSFLLLLLSLFLCLLLRILYRKHHHLALLLFCIFTLIVVLLFIFIFIRIIFMVFIGLRNSSFRKIIIEIHDRRCLCLLFLSCLIDLILLCLDPSTKPPFSGLSHLCILSFQYRKGRIFCRYFNECRFPEVLGLKDE